MKRRLLYSVILVLLIAGVYGTNNQVLAQCPIDTPCDTVFEKPMPPEIGQHPPLLNPAEHAKFKSEVERRLNLTEKQKIEIQKVKDKEAKKLEPYHKKIQKHHEELGKLFKEEHSIRKETMVKFNAVLTQEQKEEIEKIKQETLEKLKEYAPPKEMFKSPIPVNFEQKPCPPMSIDEQDTPSDKTAQECPVEQNDTKASEGENQVINNTNEAAQETQNSSENKKDAEQLSTSIKEETKTEEQDVSVQDIKNHVQMPLPKHERLQLPDRGELPVHNLHAPSFGNKTNIQEEIKLENKLMN